MPTGIGSSQAGDLGNTEVPKTGNQMPKPFCGSGPVGLVFSPQRTTKKNLPPILATGTLHLRDVDHGESMLMMKRQLKRLRCGVAEDSCMSPGLKRRMLMLEILLERSRPCCQKLTGANLCNLVTTGTEMEITSKKLSWKE